MYNKTLLNYNNNQQEILISLNSSFEKSLCYRDEGNMNIVLSLCAQDSEEKFVIRFKKIPTDVAEPNYGDHKHELMSFIHFEELLQKYFDHFTVVPKIAFIDVDIGALNEFLMRDRPVVRRNKIIGHNYGLLYRDVAFLPKKIFLQKQMNGELKDSPTTCIEIKVKQGYMMSDDCGSLGDFDVEKCRYCYFQFLKLKTAKIGDISSYCPIDLFSGNAKRMNCAIKGLIENPQNNLKIFQDGKMVYNEYSFDKKPLNRVMKSLFADVTSVEKQEILIINLIRKILLKDFTTCCDSNVDVCTNFELTENVHLRTCTSEILPQLPRNCILNSILKAQKLVRDNLSNMELLDKHNNDCIDGYEQIIQDYRMGSTALDCSVMITLKKIHENGIIENDRDKLFDRNHYVTMGPTDLNHHNFIVNATIVDLDEKKDSIAHFHKYRKQYRDSKIAYLEFMKNN